MLGLTECPIPMVTEDNNLTLGVVWVVATDVFDDQSGHGWDGSGCIAFASEAKIICFVYHGVDLVIE